MTFLFSSCDKHLQEIICKMDKYPANDTTCFYVWQTPHRNHLRNRSKFKLNDFCFFSSRDKHLWVLEIIYKMDKCPATDDTICFYLWKAPQKTICEIELINVYVNDLSFFPSCDKHLVKEIICNMDNVPANDATCFIIWQAPHRNTPLR